MTDEGTEARAEVQALSLGKCSVLFFFGNKVCKRCEICVTY